MKSYVFTIVINEGDDEWWDGSYIGHKPTVKDLIEAIQLDLISWDVIIDKIVVIDDDGQLVLPFM